MESSSYITLTPSWNTQGPYDIRVYLRCEFLDEENSSQETGINSSALSGVILSTPSTGPEPCLLHVHCKPGAEVVAAAILSNARHVELHSDIDGYMGTVRGEKLPNDRESDSLIYRKEVKFERPRSSFKLKFVSLTDKTHLHLQQVHIALKRTRLEEAIPPLFSDRHGNVDMDHVRELLSSQEPISERAQSLMSNVEQYQKNQSEAMHNLQEATRQTLTNQKSGAGDVGMMGQMAGLLSSLSRSNSSGSHGTMQKLISSFSGEGDSHLNDNMYRALQLMCRDVTQWRSLSRENVSPEREEGNKNKISRSRNEGERFSDDEKIRETSPVLSSLESQLQPFIISMEERIAARLEARLDSLQSHFDLRLNRLETMLSEVLLNRAVGDSDETEKELNGDGHEHDERESDQEKYS